jgi:glycosyltransferase involved in cell wall biosynthesis
MLEGDAKWGALHGCEALILPSQQENFGIVVAEAMACNKPVLITNKVNIWREIAKHKAGVVMNDDFEDIKKTIEDYGTTTFTSEQKFSTNPLKCYKECFKTSEYTYRLFNILSGNSCE